MVEGTVVVAAAAAAAAAVVDRAGVPEVAVGSAVRVLVVEAVVVVTGASVVVAVAGGNAVNMTGGVDSKGFAAVVVITVASEGAMLIALRYVCMMYVVVVRTSIGSDLLLRVRIVRQLGRVF